MEFNFKGKDDEGAKDQYQGLSIPSFDWSKPKEDEEEKRKTLSEILYEKNPYLRLYFEKIMEVFEYIYSKNIAEGKGRKILALDMAWIYALSKLSNAMDLDILEDAMIEPNLKHCILEYCDLRAHEVGPMYKYILQNNLQDKVKELDKSDPNQN